MIRLLKLLLLISAASPAWAASANVRVNSVGYIDSQPKRATVLTAAGANAFNVRRASDNVSVFASTLGANVAVADTGQNVRFADFDSVTAAGTYYLDVTGVGTSVNFAIGDNVFNEALWVTVMGFYNQRCGQATSMTYKGETWGHGACHVNDGSLLYYSGAGTKNGVGGWHDAGDFGKYIVNTGITLGQMMQAWERYGANLQSLTLPSGVNAGMPDYLEEVKYELDWVLKMQFPDGRVSHKLTRTGFEPYPYWPQNDLATRYFVPWGSAATASFAAQCALASRIFQPYDAAFASALLNAANLSYAYLVANPADVAPDQSCCSTGGYGSGDSDDRLWAAAEVWETTGSAAALADLEARINAQGADKSDFNWDWGDVSNLGIYTYALSARAGKNAATNTDVRNDIVADATTMMNNADGHGYGRALGMYYWGANGTVVRQAQHLDMANRITPNPGFLDAAGQQLAWTFSRNYYNRSQATGLGLSPPLNPHDRESSADALANPKPGHLVGGGHPGATDWVDDSASYQTNEIAINWDGALTYALAMWYKPGGAPLNSPTISPTFTRSPTASPTPTPLPCGLPANVRRVNVGGALFVDGGANSWSADQAYVAGGWGYVAAGTTSLGGAAIAGTTDDLLYQDQRWSASLEYRFTVPNGSYQVTVKMAETYWTGAGQRVMAFSAEGASVFGSVDIFAAAPGANQAYDLGFLVTVSDGVLNLVFNGSVDNATIAGISVDTAVSGPCATNTHSPTGTRTPSRTMSASFTPSRTSSPSGTPSWTSTLSRTPSGSPTQSLTQSSTRTLTGTPSFSRTHSPTLSQTQSATPSQSMTPSPSSTRSPTPSLTRTLTGTGTSSPSRTASRTLTATPSSSPTVTLTLTRSPSPSVTQTNTPVPPGSTDTSTPSPSPSFSASPSRTPSPTASPSLTATSSASPTPSGTMTATGSLTLTRTPTSTPSPTGSRSATSTFTVTQTGTPTVSGTLSATPSRTPTETSTTTLTQTVSGSPSSSASPSNSATPTSTSSVSPSPAASPSQSPSETPSPLPSASPSATGTPTASPTPNMSPSLSPTLGPPDAVSVSVQAGPLSGGTQILISGVNFSGVNSVTLNGQSFSNVVVLNDSTISAVTPPGLAPGWADLSVSRGAQSDVLSAAFEYKPPQGDPRIVEALAVPNPQTGPGLALSILLEGRADQFEARVYTQALALAGVYRSAPGIHTGRILARFDCDLAGGLYWIRLSALSQGRAFPDKAIRDVYFAR